MTPEDIKWREGSIFYKSWDLKATRTPADAQMIILTLFEPVESGQMHLFYSKINFSARKRCAGHGFHP